MTYLYETIPAKEGGKTRQFEIKQSIKDAALTKHPDTGEPIRRVISGGWGLMGKKAERPPAGGGGHRCHGPGCC
jgi:predicted nucleic acid-binding Zn ribbon protein